MLRNEDKMRSGESVNITSKASVNRRMSLGGRELRILVSCRKLLRQTFQRDTTYKICHDVDINAIANLSMDHPNPATLKNGLPEWQILPPCRTCHLCHLEVFGLIIEEIGSNIFYLLNKP